MYLGEGIAFRTGDVLYGKLRPYLAKVYVADMPGEAVGDFHVIRPDANLDSRFLAYALLTRPATALLNGSTHGAKMPRVSWEVMGRLTVPVPPLNEQIDVVHFLDREVSRLDSLILAHEELVDLLRDKRELMISHAVTRGFTPSEMMPSGSAWIGEIPCHWSIKRLKQVASVQTGVAKGKDITSKETVSIPYLRVANVQADYVDLTDVANIDIPKVDVQRYLLKEGDVLMNEGGDYDKLGRGAVWNAQINPCIHQNHVFAVRPHSIQAEWIALSTRARYARSYFISRSKQSTNLASISSTNLMELPIVCPPAVEVDSILYRVAMLTRRVEDAIDATEQLICILHERRSALIFAAATGKIDIRSTVDRTSGLTSAEAV